MISSGSCYVYFERSWRRTSWVSCFGVVLLFLSITLNLPAAGAEPLETFVPHREIVTEEPELSIEEQIIAIAEEEGYRAPLFLVRLAKCESGLDRFAVGAPGCPSCKGLFQIYTGLGRDITDEQAYDVEWSTRWTIEQLRQGRASFWPVCSTILQ